MARQMQLERLAAEAGPLSQRIEGAADTVITGLAYDSRKVLAGDLFFCIPGTRTDGHQFAAKAVADGAAALVVERPTGAGVSELVVSDARRAMPLIAAGFLEHPADKLTILGVTGTNGKTTTAFLLESIIEAAGLTSGLIGTIETRIAGERKPGVRTTPESLDLQLLFAEMVDRGVQAVAMEVTSHALVLNRVEGVTFAAAAFTNLSQDHLDFHSGMEDYFEAKKLLFLPERLKRGAVNVDDPYGRKLYESTEVPCLGFGANARDAQVRVESVTLADTYSEFDIITPQGTIHAHTSLVGAFNVLNCLAAATTALAADIDLSSIEKGLNSLASVPGRFEAIDEGQPFAVVVDYAHTPDSLDNVLRAARRLVQARDGRVICVFGCGGDRDRGKRPLMGEVVARLADVAIVTSDNPRSEDPRAIIDEILEGVVAAGVTPAAVLVDRHEAINEAVFEARPGDIVVVAGKGHETGQEFADKTIPFDDRLVAAEALRSAGWERDG
jgi:UDP-N-acetylmuramoyl-L-alanyl-D-glutamate--2,6-diaminopimelate ligase